VNTKHKPNTRADFGRNTLGQGATRLRKMALNIMTFSQHNSTAHRASLQHSAQMTVSITALSMNTYYHYAEDLMYLLAGLQLSAV
jgi:hypothetical protein